MLVAWSSDQNGASEQPFGAVGMMVINDTAAALGITAIPSPVSDPSSPWYVWEPLAHKTLFSTAAGFAQNVAYSATVDSKAMRKIGENEDVAVVAENAHASQGAVINVIGRFLIKTH